MVGSAYFVKSTPPRALILSRFVPDILKMCMKNFYAENFSLDRFTAF